MLHSKMAREITDSVSKENQEGIMKYIMSGIERTAKMGGEETLFRYFQSNPTTLSHTKTIYWRHLNKTNRKHIISILTNVGYEVEGLHSKKLRIYW